MSLRIQRLSFLTPLLAVGLALSGCEDEYPTEPPVIDPPTAPENQLVVISDVRPPPISGGTLLVSHDGLNAIVADPDRDRIVLVDLASSDIKKEITLEDGDEPGRVIEDGSGRAHIALRRGGAIVSIDIATGELLGRRNVCAAPRGLASFAPIEGGDATLLVACASGELVELAADPSGGILETTVIEPDLRDIVITGDGTRAGRRVLVSSFRSAHLIALGPNNEVEGESQPAGYNNEFSGRSFAPTVAWKTVATPTGAVMIHQRSATVPIEIEPEEPSGYGGAVFDCGQTIVNASTTSYNQQGARITADQRGGIGAQLLPVDIAVADASGLLTSGDDDRMVAFVAAGSDMVTVGTLSGLENADGCTNNFVENGFTQMIGPEPIAAAFGPMQTNAIDLVVQLREPSMIVVLDALTMQQKSQISLGGKNRFDSGHQLFHRNPETQSTISCASCHPEGREDSHTWQFVSQGARRTQSLEGDVMETAPFHWDGELDNMGELMTDVFEHRMGGLPQSEQRVDALKTWLSNNKRVGHPAGSDDAAIARGKTLFEDDVVACSSCHSGKTMTNNENVDVGTGRAFQVPSLIGVRNRAPYMHDGCATTLFERFDNSCGGDKHGDISNLSEGDIDDLVTYMDSL
jgi:Cytochrome c